MSIVNTDFGAAAAHFRATGSGIIYWRSHKATLTQRGAVVRFEDPHSSEPVTVNTQYSRLDSVSAGLVRKCRGKEKCGIWRASTRYCPIYSIESSKWAQHWYSARGVAHVFAEFADSTRQIHFVRCVYVYP